MEAYITLLVQFVKMCLKDSHTLAQVGNCYFCKFILMLSFLKFPNPKCYNIPINTIRQSITHLLYIHRYTCQGDMFRPSRSSLGPPRKQIQELLVFLHCGIPNAHKIQLTETCEHLGSGIYVALTYTVFTRVIHALFLTKILYLNLGCVIYARKRFYVGL